MEFRENEAIYMQVASFVTENIMLDKWQADEKIPSVRELASNLQVNPHTVVRAYEILQNREVIANKRGIGFFVLSDAKQKIKSFGKERFMGHDLPELLKNMYLLGISIDEIDAQFKKYKASIQTNKSL
jgi:GntR family transcriptional regulator